jgi:hypothetical protein
LLAFGLEEREGRKKTVSQSARGDWHKEEIDRRRRSTKKATVGAKAVTYHVRDRFKAVDERQ